MPARQVLPRIGELSGHAPPSLLRIVSNIAAVDEQPLPEDVVQRLLTSHRFAISLSNAAHWPIAAADAMA